MGLDVYLYHYTENPEPWLEKQDQYNSKSEEIWKGQDYNALDSDQKTDLRTQCRDAALALGLSECGEIPDTVKQCIEVNSELHHDHLFSMGYFRSSYNQAGYNSVASDVLGVYGLYAVFPEADKENYVLKINWQDALTRAEAQLASWQKLAEKPCFGVIESTYNPFGGPNNEVNSSFEALSLFNTQNNRYQEAVEKGNRPFGSFSNRDGQYYLEKPIKIFAAVQGVRKYLNDEQPCTYLIHEVEDHYEWYRQAAEIVVETIKYVLAQPDPENYRLHWSG